MSKATRNLSLVVGRYNRSLISRLGSLWSVFQLFGWRGWLVVVGGAVATLVLIGLPSGIIDNAFFSRMTPVRAQDCVIWVLTGILAGLVVATFTVPVKTAGTGRAVSGGFLSFFAVGCPVCNKLVILALGASGALTYFAPLQIYIGIVSLALLGSALYLRVKAINRSCCGAPQDPEAQEADSNR